MNPSKFISILNVVFLSLFLQCQTSYAAVAAGSVQFVIGDVHVTNEAGKTRQLKKGEIINEGDVVATAVSASVQIKMNDGGFIAIRPDTKMKFDKFVYNGAEDGEERSFLSLLKGGFRAVTGLIGNTHKQNYKITTTVATIGIRGTDHETFFVPNGNEFVQAGAYSKVNVGETTLTTNRGTVNVLPNQMGFASGLNDEPRVVPVNTHVFTVASAPTKTIRENKAEQVKQSAKPVSSEKPGEQQSGGMEAKDASPANGSQAESVAKVAVNANDVTSIRSAETDNFATTNNYRVAGDNAAQMSAQPDQSKLSAQQLIVPIILTNAATGATLDATNQTDSEGGVKVTLTGSQLVAFAYSANHVAVESTGFNTQGSLVDPVNLVYVTGAAGGGSASGALVSFQEQNLEGWANWTFNSTITGGTASSYNAPSVAVTGIQYGSWTGYSAQTSTTTYALGSGNNGKPTGWMYAPQGYIDAAYLSGSTSIVTGAMSGTFSYQLDGANAPRYQSSGVAGTLNSASVTANFTNMTVSASLGLNIGSDYWGASLSNQAIGSVVGGAFSASAVSSGTANTLTVTHGASAAQSCSTCSGNLSGMFTGQNFSGAMLAYSLSDSAQGSTVYGDAALTRVGAVANSATPSPTGLIVIDNGFGSLSTYSSATFSTTGNVLTQYGNSTNQVAVSCPDCVATASASGIYYGTWTSGTYTSTSVIGSSFSVAPLYWVTGQYWITGPEAGPLYLPQALIGKASYALDAGQVSNSTGAVGTVNATTALAVNFTNQTVGINLDATIAGHTWNASTVAGSEAPLSGSQGIGGAAFHASTSSSGTGGSNAGLLTISVDGTSNSINSGSINGQLTGNGLTGAIISFTLNGVSGVNGPYSDSLTGVAAFTGADQSTTASYRTVLTSAYDTAALVQTIGIWANNPSRVLQDADGNVIQFDSRFVNGNGNAVTISNSASTPTDAGSDPVTGISWGRWAGGTLNVTNRATGAMTSTPLSGSLHWIAEPVSTTAVTLPVSGTFAYTYAGGTRPTDNLGNVGTLNSATVSANFTNQTVNVGVNASVAGATLNATASNTPIVQSTAIYASSLLASTSPSYLTVSCTGSCAGTTGGTVVGKFTGAGATGIAMTYGLQNGSSVVSGVAAFHR